ncbi:MAG: Na/Pi symporter [Candidatus Cloacimonadia bacterium]
MDSESIFRRTDRREGLFRGFLLAFFIYLFFLSIVAMGEGFKGFSAISEALLTNVSNPIMGLVIGILATSILQSSSTTTSITVGLVASNILGANSIQIAIPIIMGANIGTTITNSLVSMGHISHSIAFKNAFRAAVVHDIFNILAVAICFPLEISFHIIEKAAVGITKILTSAHIGGAEFKSPITAITKPVAHTLFDPSEKTGLLEKLFSPNIAQIIIIIISLCLLFLSLRYIVKLMRKLVVHRTERFFNEIIFRNAWLALLFGIILTAIVQSSSITTSLVIPLAAGGILSIEQVFPYTVGANIGTTITTLLAALATGSIPALTVALSHLCFNLFGTVVIMPIKAIREIPIRLSGMLTNLLMINKFLPLVFILFVFFGIPILVLVIS